MLIKKIVSAILTLITVAFSPFFAYLFPTVSAVSQPYISAYSAVLMNAQTNEILMSKGKDDVRSMASTTKIMTAILAIESGKLHDEVEIKAEMTGAEGTSIGLKEGYIMSLETLVYGMLLESGNDSANAVAIYIGSNAENFAKMMNDKAKLIGMSDTNFVTASGLDDDQHFTTAYDMALLGSYAIKNEKFREICSTQSKRMNYIEPKMEVTFSNHNRLLSEYDGTIGIKTGFTKKSGRCLVSAVERDGVTLVAVTLNAGDDWNDHKKMFDFGFETINTETIDFDSIGTVNVQGANQNELKTKLTNDKCIFSYIEKSEDIRQEIYLPKMIYAPIEKGEILGEIKLYYGENLLDTVSILADEDVESIEPTYVEKTSLFEKIKLKIIEWFKW